MFVIIKLPDLQFYLYMTNLLYVKAITNKDNELIL